MDKYWNLLIAIFMIVASMAVMFIGLLVLADGSMVCMISIFGGLIGIVVGILMGIFTIVTAKTQRFDS